MALTLANLQVTSIGSFYASLVNITFDSSYPTGGESLTPDQIGLTQVVGMLPIAGVSGYEFDYDTSAETIVVYSGASGTTGATSGGTPAGTNAASTALDVATPVFSGTGQTSAGQVITTTDNQTMTLNQCAGMWFVSASNGPYLIESNTAVTGAPAVLTIYGTAPTTDAGTYRIYKNAAQTFTGSALGTHTHSIGAAAGGEVANGTNLSSVTIDFMFIGR